MPGLPLPPLLNTPHEEYKGAKTPGDSRAIAVRFGPLKFVPLPEGEFTYSQTLKKIKWHKIFPAPEVISKYIEEQTKVSFLKSNIGLNVATCIVSFMYFISFIALIVRSSIYVNDEELFKTAHISQHVREFTDSLGYFLATYMIINIASGYALFKLYILNKKARATFKDSMSDYISKREDVINTRECIMLFFTIAEKIYLLEQPESIFKFSDHREKVLKLFEKYKLDTKGHRVEHFNSVYQLKEFLYSSLQHSKFEYIVNRIKKSIKDNMTMLVPTIRDELLIELKLREIGELGKLKQFTKAEIVSMLGSLDINGVIKYCNWVDGNVPTQNLIFYLIGETSGHKTRPNASMLLEPINILEDGVDDILKKAVSNYWNSNSTEALVHPHGVKVIQLAKVVNLKIIYGHFMALVNPEYRMPAIVPSASPSMVTRPSSPLWRMVTTNERRLRTASLPARGIRTNMPTLPPCISYCPQPIRPDGFL